MTDADDLHEPLPEEIDPALWFPCRHDPTTRDYLYPSSWHTFPGRMGAYCAGRKVWFRASKMEIPDDAPAATKYWVRGFLAGNLPEPPSREIEGDDLAQWNARAQAFFETGSWPTKEQTQPGWLTIRLRAENGADLTAVFEPIGAVYELSSGESMTAEVLSHNDDADDVIEIISTPGVISIVPPGHVQTRDGDGNDLHWLN